MNNVKNYKRGARRDAIYLLHGCGLLTYRAMRVQPFAAYSHDFFQKTLNKMIREGVLAKHTTASADKITFFCLDNYEDNVNMTAVAIDDACVDYYRENYKTKICDVWNEKSQRPMRRIQDAEVIAIMYAAGISVMPDQGEGNIKYYTSKEVKQFANYGDDVKIKGGERKVQFTKSFGLLTSPKNDYAVYRLNKRSLDKLSQGEYKIKNQYNEVLVKIKKGAARMDDSLLLVDDLTYLTEYIANDELSERIANQYLNITNVYDRVYALPYDEHGRDMIKLMTEENWRQRMMYILFDVFDNPDEASKLDTTYVGYQCDHYDRQNDVGTLVFCAPDIKKLKSFVDYAAFHTKKDQRKHYRVICFDFQREFVAQVVKRYAGISYVPFDAYIEELQSYDEVV